MSRRCIRFLVVLLLLVPGMCSGPLGLSPGPGRRDATRVTDAARLDPPPDTPPPQCYDPEPCG